MIHLYEFRNLFVLQFLKVLELLHILLVLVLLRLYDLHVIDQALHLCTFWIAFSGLEKQGTVLFSLADGMVVFCLQTLSDFFQLIYSCWRR